MSYTPITALSVFLHDMLVGRLALSGRRVWFQYDAAFLSKGLELSPFKLPLKPDVIVNEDYVFEGLFGLFNDSLPDGWGRLLLDRYVRNLGITSETLTVLDRLACVGQNGMGALTYKPDHSPDNSGRGQLDLDQLASESRAVLDGAAENVIEELLALNGSSSGARPKIMAAVSKDKKHIVHGTGASPAGHEHWLIKFTSSSDPEDNGAIEYAYSLMAKAAGLVMPETYLFPANKGAGYFGVKRFDRDGKRRMHMHTVSGLLHADYRAPSLDYASILALAMVLTRSSPDVEELFRLAVFNVFARNRDDHAKNFSFLMDNDGTWHTAPAYDLTFSSGPMGEHSTTIMGEGKNPGRSHLQTLGKKFGLKQADEIIEQTLSAIARWDEFANMAGVSRQSKKLIKKNIG